MSTQGFVEVRLPITKLASGPISAMGYGKAAEKGDFVTFRMRWLDFAALKRTWVGSDSLWEGDRCDSTSSYHFKCSSDKAAVYEPIGAKQVMKIERCQDILDTWKQYYGEDSLYDDLCDRCPTVKKLRAVHGVNVPTEAAYALRVQTIRLKQSEILTRLAFDEAASSDIHGYSFQGGTVHANGSSKALSGDGVVPLSSLEECRNWAKAGLDSELTSIPGVEHRAILADAHFHQIIKDSVLLKGRQSMQQEPPLRFSIAGTFSNWKPEQMTWDGACFVRVLSIGPNGWESFQILLDSSWDKVFYPNVKDAGPTVPHSILGPDNHNAGKDWTIGKNRGKLLEGLLRPGSAFKVKLELNSGKPQSVTWEPFSLVEVLRAKGTWQMQKRGVWSDLPAECSVTLNSELALARPSAEMQIQQQRCRIDLLNMQLINFATKEQVPVRRIWRWASWWILKWCWSEVQKTLWKSWYIVHSFAMSRSESYRLNASIRSIPHDSLAVCRWVLLRPWGRSAWTAGRKQATWGYRLLYLFAYTCHLYIWADTHDSSPYYVKLLLTPVHQFLQMCF